MGPLLVLLRGHHPWLCLMREVFDVRARPSTIPEGHSNVPLTVVSGHIPMYKTQVTPDETSGSASPK